MNTVCMRLPLCRCHTLIAFLPAAVSSLAGRHRIVQKLVHGAGLANRRRRWSGAAGLWLPLIRTAHVGTCTSAERQPSRWPPDEASASASHQTTVTVYFGNEGVYTTAEPGENLWAVASKAGVVIPTSCNSGSCGTCEMEVRKWDEAGLEGGTSIARTCIAAVPPGYVRLQLDAMDDGIWGADGFDM